MNTMRRTALQLYYAASLPARRRAARYRSAQGTEPVRGLFYHRVADDQPSDWTIDTRTFRQQVAWLAENFDIVTLAEAQRRIASGTNDRPTACITFDDGYGDNCQTAIPLLIDEGIPFTYFVTTENVLAGKRFGHDLEAGLDLRPNTLAELQDMVAAGVEIGSHSCTHADLGQPLSLEDLCEEIVTSKDELEQALGVEMRYFAFPFGMAENLSAKAFQIAYAAGYAGVCSAYGGYNLPGDDPFHIRRLHGDPETVRLKNWLTIDPWRRGTELQFDPGDYQVAEPALI